LRAGARWQIGSRIFLRSSCPQLSPLEVYVLRLAQVDHARGAPL
jgi:hypothetical protein